jgi:hypothetical protein
MSASAEGRGFSWRPERILGVLSGQKLFTAKNAKKNDLGFENKHLRRYAFAMPAKKLIFALLVAAALTSVLAAPQSATRPIVISVQDISGAAVPHAQVRVVPPPDSAPKMETDDKGRLSLDLKPGGYGIFVGVQGFKKFATHVDLQVGKEAQSIPVVLQLDSGSHVEVSAPADFLMLWTYPYHDGVKLSVSEFKALPHTDVSFHNSHTNKDERYAGVRLADLLSKMGAPMGNELRGEGLALYVVATGADGYRAVRALAEADPSFHPGEVLVADTMDGKPLDPHSGPFKLVVTEDKRPARSVLNLASIELKSVQ